MNQTGLKNSLLAEPENIPLISGERVKNWGKTLIIAPHPDDESLGCGGAIALLRRFACQVNVLIVSDGTLSHPNSVKFPAEKLRDLREAEMLDALKILGVTMENAAFLRYRDRSVPHQNSELFQAAVDVCRNYLEKIKPETILTPWRRDPHPDHLAATAIVLQAVLQSNLAIKIIEYPIWIWELASGDDAPRIDEAIAWRLDIAAVLAQKQAAIAAHQSQITNLIDDDAAGFRLTPEILANFAAPFEIYLEYRK